LREFGTLKTLRTLKTLMALIALKTLRTLKTMMVLKGTSPHALPLEPGSDNDANKKARDFAGLFLA